MPVKVVDASAVSALLFGEPKAARVVEASKGFRLAAPTLLDYEVSGVCLKKIRLHPGRREALLSAYRLLARLPVDRCPADAEATVMLAEERGNRTVRVRRLLFVARADPARGSGDARPTPRVGRRTELQVSRTMPEMILFRAS
jgi:predicted nucleic acid-binding protein